jgi:(p)ppGpp synthase/HD superfamily hydrolase
MRLQPTARRTSWHHQPVTIPKLPEGARYGPRFLRALDAAARMHAAQVRKPTEIPYLTHLVGTYAIAAEYGADEDESIAALLHDAIEDVQPTDEARRVVASFGERVLAIVEACTDADTHPKPPWRERKQRYVAHLADADASVLLVSASDKLHNARSIVRDLRGVGAATWDRFTASRDEVLWYYGALVAAFRANPAHQPALIDELERVVGEMQRLSG